jgi:hypothetical protein
VGGVKRWRDSSDCVEELICMGKKRKGKECLKHNE